MKSQTKRTTLKPHRGDEGLMNNLTNQYFTTEMILDSQFFSFPTPLRSFVARLTLNQLGRYCRRTK